MEILLEQEEQKLEQEEMEQEEEKEEGQPELQSQVRESVWLCRLDAKIN